VSAAGGGDVATAVLARGAIGQGDQPGRLPPVHRVGHRPRIGGIRLGQLTPEHLDRLYRGLETNGKRRGPCPTDGRRCQADGCTADLHEEPGAKSARSRNARDHCWTREQLVAFLGHSRERDGRLHPLWFLIATTGMRRAEALALRWSDVELQDRDLVFTRPDGTVIPPKRASQRRHRRRPPPPPSSANDEHPQAPRPTSGNAVSRPTGVGMASRTQERPRSSAGAFE
jgi:hypothetical protein